MCMCVCVCLSWRLKASDQDFFPPCSCSDRLVDSDYMEQTDRHTSYRYAHTRTHLQTESSARGFFMCVCAGFYETSWGTVSQNAQMLILNPNFLSVISTFNTSLHLPHRKPITCAHRRGARLQRGKCMD